MRRGAKQLILMMLAMSASSAVMAQALEGPLAAVDEPTEPSSTPKSAKHATARRAKPVAKRTETPLAKRLPSPTATPTAEVGAAKSTAPTDPVSFGMKWNGSNDSVGQTRIENLNGNAVGTGAEVGMKLHF